MSLSVSPRRIPVPGPRCLRALAGATAALGLSLSLAACGGDSGSGSGSDGDTTITVLAAASLKETFTELGQTFEDEHDGVSVEFAFDSSATLAQQAVEGSKADVLATADEETMQSAVDGDAVDGDPQLFAGNVLVLVTPAENPGTVTGLTDLADVTWVDCVETAPCGKVADAVLADAGIDAEPASREVDVKAVLAKVTEDEADAGLVYASDGVAAGDAVTVIDLPEAEKEKTLYPIAPLADSDKADLAQQFVDLVLSDEGQGVLQEAGFQKP